MDGSEMGLKSLRMCANMMRHSASKKSEQNDTLVIYHVTNPGRYGDLTGSKFHPDAIKALQPTITM